MMPLLTGGEIALGLVLLGLTTAASLLLKPKVNSAIKDREATTLATRGSYIPLGLGRFRTGAVILWVGDREVKRESAGKGKGGSFSAPKSKVYYEAAWHGIAVGPGYALNRIWVDGRVVWNTQITQVSHPDGSSIHIGGEGDFAIYWGNDHPPVNAFLANTNRVNVASSWPFMMYVVWNKKRLGVAPRWPVIDYDVEVRPYSTSLAGGLPYLGSTGNPLGADDGVNAAHALEQILTQPYPHGLGYSSSVIDVPSLQAFSTLCQSEQLTCSLVVRDGDSAESAVVKIAKDCGIMLPFVNGKLFIQPVRTPGSHLPILTDDLLLPPRAEIEQLLAARTVDRMDFSFIDRAHEFRANVFPIGDDSMSVSSPTKRAQPTALDIVDNLALARAVSDRRAQENLASTDVIRLQSNHAARQLYPGLPIRAAHIPSILRIVAVHPDSLSNKVGIDCIFDYYGTLGTSWEPGMGGHSGGGSPVSGDPAGVVVTPPPHSGSGTGTSSPNDPIFSTAVVLRIRGDDETLAADVYLSPDDISYHNVDSGVDAVPGGTLDGDWQWPSNYYQDVGPNVLLEQFDLNLLEDLSTLELEWSLGRMAVYINGEVLFVKKFEATGGSNYTMRGVLRARYGTTPQTHPDGTRFYIFNPASLHTFVDPMIDATSPVYAKIQPYNWEGALSLASVTSVQIERPVHMPFNPVNVRSARINGRANVLDLTAGTWVAEWNYRSIVYPKTGAGMQPAGRAVAAPSPPMGTFEIQLLTMSDTVIIEDVGIPTPSWTDTPGAISAAFGGLASGATFKIRVRENALGRYSEWVEAVITVL